MFRESRLLLYRTMTPLHCGGDEAVSGIDLPVVREKHTGFPIIPGSSLKGVWRDWCDDPDRIGADGVFADEDKKNEFVRKAFGPKTQGGADSSAGDLGFTDASLLFLPIRASVGTFLLVTCPLQLARFAEAAKQAKCQAPEPEQVLSASRSCQGPSLCTIRPQDADKHVLDESEGEMGLYLEDLEFTPGGPVYMNLTQFVESDHLRQRLVVVSNDNFQWFCRQSLPVSAHNVLDNTTKTSDNLWYEETVPSEAIFFSLILGGNLPGANDCLTTLQASLPSHLQVGGHETTGRGLVEVKCFPQAPKSDKR